MVSFSLVICAIAASFPFTSCAPTVPARPDELRTVAQLEHALRFNENALKRINKNLYERYTFESVLGRGEHGLVALFNKKKNNKKVAIKFANEPQLSSTKPEEIAILQKISDIPGVPVLKQYGLLRIPNFYYFITDPVISTIPC
jgi:hypothetical protein